MYFVLYKSKESYRELGYSYFVMLVSKQEVSMWIFFLEVSVYAVFYGVGCTQLGI
jgi:hypothetical protein